MKSKAGMIALAAKMGPKIGSILVKLAKSLKLGKAALLGASVAAYGHMFTWEFAAMLVLMLFVHESGHIWAMKRCGMKTRGIYFVPFLGGVAVTEDAFPSRGAEAFVAIMGPLWGLALAMLAGFAYLATENPLLAAASSWMALVNLFNLLPINPLDGGRILKSIAYSLDSHVGLLFLGASVSISATLALFAGISIFGFLLVIGFFEAMASRNTKHECPRMSGRLTAAAFASYALVTVVLWKLMAVMAHVPGADLAMEILKG